MRPIPIWLRRLSLLTLGVIAGIWGAEGIAAARGPGAANDVPAAAVKALTEDGLVLVPGAKLPLPATQRAAFAAGCFWGIEDAFRHQPGVLATAVGFMGGHTVAPSYEQVCTENTGHAETVELAFDPKVVSYAQLVQLFFDIHDPTTKNRQGPDVGDQYRSAIFTFNEGQRATAIAERDKVQASHELTAPIVSEITLAGPFYKAEDYHQQYVEKGGIAFCHVRRHAAASAK